MQGLPVTHLPEKYRKRRFTFHGPARALFQRNRVGGSETRETRTENHYNQQTERNGDFMNQQQIQNYQMLAKVVEFTTNNVSLFPKTPAVAEILAGLQSSVSDMSKQAGARVASQGAMRESQSSRLAARESLTRRLVLTAQVARALNSDKFQMPPRRRDHDLIAAGHAFVENGASLEKEFSNHSLPLDELSAAVEALERANFDYSSGKAVRASAIQEFDSTTAEATGYLQRLDAIVEITLAGNPTAIASWSVARTVNRSAVRKREVQPPAPVTPQSPDPPANLPAAA